MKNSKLLLLLFMFLLETIHAGNDNIRFKHITSDDGLSQSTINGIVRDHKGFMWFGTSDGLNKYDGYSFKIYRSDPENPHSISHNYISMLLEDSKGNLWIPTSGGGLNRYNREKDNFIRYSADENDPESLCTDFLYSVFEDSSGRIWIGTGLGLNLYHEDTEKFSRYTPYADDLADTRKSVWRISEIDENHLWIGSRAGLLVFDIQAGTFQPYEHQSETPRALSKATVYKIHHDPDNNLWVCTNWGLYRLDDPLGKWKVYRHDPRDKNSLSGNGITDIIDGKNGILWVMAYGGGINRLNPTDNTITRIDYRPGDPNSLGSNKILSSYIDNSGALWVGTADKGISRSALDIEKFIHYKNIPENPNSLSNNMVVAFCQDRNGTLWIGTANGGLNKFDRKNQRFTHYKADPSKPGTISSNYVNSILEDSDGILWISTLGGGLNRFNPETETFTVFRHKEGDPNSLSSNSVTTLFEDSRGNIWVGTHLYLNKIDRKTGKFAHYPSIPDDPTTLSDRYISKIHEDTSGNLWIGTFTSGLNRMESDSGKITRYLRDKKNPRSLSSDLIFYIYQDSPSYLWLGTYGGGLVKFEIATGDCTSYRVKDGLPNDSVLGILPAKDGNLWLSTSKGLSCFDPRTETFKNYTQKDGLQSNEFSTKACYVNAQGEMFFGGPNGFNSFFPDRITDNPYVPPVVITEFQISYKPVKVSADSPLTKPVDEIEQITLDYKQNIFAFSFVALDYTIPEKNRYRYMLENFDSHWIDVGADRRFAAYTNIPPGNYVFRVKGSNNDGVWNESGAAVKIRITPPFWSTWWFRALIVLIFGGAVYTWHYWRMKMLSIKMKTESEIERFFDKNSLSSREQEIARLILKGKSNRDIENALFISLSTVKSHVYKIYRKMGVKTRMELIHLLQTTISQHIKG